MVSETATTVSTMGFSHPFFWHLHTNRQLILEKSSTVCDEQPMLRRGGGATEGKTHLSWSRLRGYFDPGGNNGLSSGVFVAGGGSWEDLEEFPAFPDLTMPLFGGITVRGAK